MLLQQVRLPYRVLAPGGARRHRVDVVYRGRVDPGVLLEEVRFGNLLGGVGAVPGSASVATKVLHGKHYRLIPILDDQGSFGPLPRAGQAAAPTTGQSRLDWTCPVTGRVKGSFAS